ncbi:MAG: DUF4301 family protein, partial [Flavobacteriales bacterium]|nr:DUF4301 family protein [Flavobacteriales bacterium]
MESLIQDMIQAGVPEDLAYEQCRLIERGVRYVDLFSSASIQNGISKLDAAQVDVLAESYDQRSQEVTVLKFVPASGAATRMFKDLISEWKTGEPNPGSDLFFEQLSDIPFAHLLDIAAAREEILEQLLSTERLDMDNRPKGSILFHRYPDEVRTAFEEHLVEGVEYASSGGKVHLHFTLSPDHIEDVKSSLHAWAKDYAERLDCTYDLQFSIQLPFTDTVPFDLQGRPLMNGERVLTRPGGHGSLIYNLNKLDADMIFIKNIDNVVPDKHRGDTVRYKKALAGMLIEARKEARGMISDLKASDDEATRARAIHFLERMGLKLE